MWFLNDLGGCYVNGGYDSGESERGVNAWTQVVGPYATNLLQNRNEDATLGIVLMNYADPNDEYTGNLIQTIINNNFNFQLRKNQPLRQITMPLIQMAEMPLVGISNHYLTMKLSLKDSAKVHC